MIRLPVTWSVCGFVESDKPTIAEAVNHFKEHSDEYSLPADNEYVDGSFELSSEDEESIILYQE